MALIRCPECGKEVSDKAPACVHCGYPLQKGEGKCNIINQLNEIKLKNPDLHTAPKSGIMKSLQIRSDTSEKQKQITETNAMG